ncbi:MULTISPECIES: hypothetical protein [unclassified Frankia]|uniref:hypothetical protein n=1 Tax=unclassified Frankia TaxID=2632575 RepID=UPI002AD4A98F|nr:MULTISPECIES: hypothetical protein [unclassified Frankia]
MPLPVHSPHNASSSPPVIGQSPGTASFSAAFAEAASGATASAVSRLTAGMRAFDMAAILAAASDRIRIEWVFRGGIMA